MIKENSHGQGTSHQHQSAIDKIINAIPLIRPHRGHSIGFHNTLDHNDQRHSATVRLQVFHSVEALE